MSSGEEHESKAFSDEQLVNSPTLQKLSILSRVNPININNRVEIESALASSLVYLVDAADNDNIQFQSKADEGAFFQMLLVSHQLITQIQPTSSVRH
ncbi:hypothetical protein [Methylobacter tundripaludum]|uniref:hypothetical protein n=1 Tax=Methylobacter tundripaludum TaxID=173365 RepID=UPI000485CF98|nr:hypothetical protein [Methylobacter tundripaludum]